MSDHAKKHHIKLYYHKTDVCTACGTERSYPHAPARVMRYAVWFDQINQTRFIVEAKSEDEAIKKATRQWQAAYGHAAYADIQVVQDTPTPGGQAK